MSTINKRNRIEKRNDVYHENIDINDIGPTISIIKIIYIPKLIPNPKLLNDWCPIVVPKK